MNRLTANIELEPRLVPALLANLVRDTVTTAAASNSGPLTEFLGFHYFAADDGARGRELWRTDGTSSGTTFVADIIPGSTSSDPLDFVNVNGTLFFTAFDAAIGRELWKTDGTSTGTVLVRDLSSFANGNSYFFNNHKELTNLNGLLVFTATDGVNGRELWRSDGTSAGTAMVRDLPNGVSAASLTVMNGSLYFGQNNTLWKSDGTSTGTTAVRAFGFGLAFLTNYNGTLVFAAGDTERELWKSDGTSTGTVLVRDINTSGSSYPSGFLAVGTTLYFTATTATNGTELWKSDGTSSGTAIVRDIRSGTVSSYPSNLAQHAGTLYFRANNGTGGYELWKSNGTSTGTLLVRDLYAGTSSGSPREFTVANNVLYFTAVSGSSTGGLWRTDGTSAGTTIIRSFVTSTTYGVPAVDAGNLSVVNASLAFAGNTGTGRELWKSDGASTSTVLVKDIAPGTTSGNPRKLFNNAGTLYFESNGTNFNTELWISNGTSSGTTLLATYSPNGYSHLNFPANFAGKLYFDSGPNSGRTVGFTNGTAAGTSGITLPFGQPGATANSLASIGTALLFPAANMSDVELYRSSDGINATLVRDINPGFTSSTPRKLISVNGRAVFTANAPSPGMWTSDGTSGGTTLIANYSGPNSPLEQAAIGGTLFLSANFGSGYELYKSDGFSASTVLDIETGSGSSNPSGFTQAGGFTYFSAGTGSSGRELWRTDGTPAGTKLVKDILPGAAGSDPQWLANVNGLLYFQANDGTGSEIWVSDGTSIGTVKFVDLNAAPAGSRPQHLVNFNGTLIFQADGGTGPELWSSNGTVAGTAMTDLETGSNAAPQNFRAVGNTLFFTAFRNATGFELNSLIVDSIAPQISSITSTSASGTYTTGQSVNVRLNFSETVTLAGTLSLALDTGANLTINSFTGTTANATYVIAAGQTSPDLNVTALVLTGTLQDPAGNAANLALPISNLANNVNIIVNPPPPSTSFTVNATATQRSRLTNIELSFSAPVNAATLNITLTRTTPNDAALVDVNNGLILSATTGMVTNLMLTFANVSNGFINHGSLADGRWQLAIPSLNYVSPLDGTNLRRLFGDVDANGTVDAADFSFFPPFGAAVGSAFDFNNNGDIDSGTDLSEFGNRFGLTL